ncbi:hypothetical protein Esti_003157 [Eimeria stiedai]
MVGHRLCARKDLSCLGRFSLLLESHHHVPLRNVSRFSTSPSRFRGSAHPRKLHPILRYGGATPVFRTRDFAGLHALTSLVAEGQPVDTVGATTPEDATFAALAAAQEAAVLPLKSAANTTLSEAWKAVVEVGHLLEAQRRLLHCAKRLQRSQAFLCIASQTQSLLKTEPTAASFQSVTTAACCLPPTVLTSLREVANGVAAQCTDLPIRRLLLFCEKLERMDCCTPSLTAAVLQRLISRSAFLQPYEVALGLQVVALLMNPGGPREVLEVYGLRMQQAASTRNNHPEIQQMCLAAAAQLLDMLIHNEILRRKLSVRMLVRTAEACGRLFRQAQNEPEPHGSPTMFAAAAAGAASLGALQDGEGGSMAPSTAVGSGFSCLGFSVRVNARNGNRLTLTNCDGATMGSGSCRLIEGALQPATQKASALPEGKAAGRLLMAACARRIRLSLAPRAAALLLEEACARQQHEKAAAAHRDLAWGVESVRAAMATASSGSQTQPTRVRLLNKLLLRLRQLQRRPLDSREGRQVEAREKSETEDSYEEQVGCDTEASTLGVAPIALASVCHSLATSGITFSTRQLDFIFRLIQASLPVDDGGVASTTGLRNQQLVQHTICSLANEVHAVRQASSQAASGSGSSGTRNSPSLPARLQYPCKFAAFYGEWTTVLWAGARLLKTVASPSAQDSILIGGHQLLAGQLLPRLVERLSVAEPRDVGQIADALRLLLLVDAKTHAFTQDSHMPLLLRQKLQPVDRLLAMLQALGRHLVQHSQTFGAVEILECLRLFVQLDLLYCLDVELEGKACKVPPSAGAQKQTMERGGPALFATKHSAMVVSATGVLCSALPRLLTLVGHEFTVPRATSDFEGQSLQQNPKHYASPSRDVYARNLLRSLTLKYPGELLRLPKAIRRGVMKQLSGQIKRQGMEVKILAFMHWYPAWLQPIQGETLSTSISPSPFYSLHDFAAFFVRGLESMQRRLTQLINKPQALSCAGESCRTSPREGRMTDKMKVCLLYKRKVTGKFGFKKWHAQAAVIGTNLDWNMQKLFFREELPSMHLLIFLLPV